MRQMLTLLDKKRAFLDALAGLDLAVGSVPEAARAAGVCRQTPYYWRKVDPDFAQRWAAIDDRRYAAHLAACRAAYAERRAAQSQRLAEQARRNFAPYWRKRAS